MINVGLLITARLKSSRLPLKLLARVQGDEIIRHVIRRAKQVHGIEKIVLCTSTNSQDLPLIDIANEEGIYSYSGSEDDVLSRLKDAASIHQLSHCVSITADNPLFCSYHASRVVDSFRKNPCIDYVYIPDLPLGTATYGLKTSAVRAVCDIKRHSDTEIWGPFINRPDFFNVFPMEVDDAFKVDTRLTVDHAEDYEFVLALADKFSSPLEHMTVLDAKRIIANNPELSDYNRHIVQKGVAEKVLLEIDAAYSSDNIESIKSIVEGYRDDH